MEKLTRPVQVSLFDDPPAWMPTGGVIVFIGLLLAVAFDSGVDAGTAGAHLFWGILALIAAVICIAGGIK